LLNAVFLALDIVPLPPTFRSVVSVLFNKNASSVLGGFRLQLLSFASKGEPVSEVAASVHLIAQSKRIFVNDKGLGVIFKKVGNSGKKVDFIAEASDNSWAYIEAKPVVNPNILDDIFEGKSKFENTIEVLESLHTDANVSFPAINEVVITCEKVEKFSYSARWSLEKVPGTSFNEYFLFDRGEQKIIKGVPIKVREIPFLGK
jgi:hypothetical protein